MRRQHVGKGRAGFRKERISDSQRPWEAWPRQALGVGLDCAGPQVLLRSLSFPYLTLPASSVDFPDHWAST